MPVKVGVSTALWLNASLPITGQVPSRDTLLVQAAAIGFAGIEAPPDFLLNPPDLHHALLSRHLACASLSYACQLLRRDAEREMVHLRPLLDRLKATGANTLVLMETSNAIHTNQMLGLARRPILPHAAWKEFGRRLSELAEETAQLGVRLAYRPHIGTIIATESDIDTLMSATHTAVHLALDSAHACWGGADPAILARKYRSRIVHLYAHDIRPAMLAASRLNNLAYIAAIAGAGPEPGIFAPPGEGCIDFAALFKALPDYDGWVIVEAEQDPGKADPLASAVQGFKHVRAALAAARA